MLPHSVGVRDEMFRGGWRAAESALRLLHVSEAHANVALAEAIKVPFPDFFIVTFRGLAGRSDVATRVP
jgi:hypothetical protein